jgi:hypothetical protein
MSTTKTDLPVRVGIFKTVAAADRAVRGLLEAGFAKEQLSVICSDEHKERHFRGLPHPPIPGSNTMEGIATGGVIGAAIGGLALAASAVATGGAMLLTVGPMLVAGGAIAGSFTGAMATRGFEPEVANYYDQAVRRGDILVAVEVTGAGADHRLAEAERVFAAAGAEPVPLPEG